MTKIKIDWVEIFFVLVLTAFIFITCLFVPRFIEVQKEKNLHRIQADINRYADGPYDKLETACRKMIRLTPEDCSWWALLGQALHFEGRDKEAIEAIEKAIRLDKTGNNPTVWECKIHLGRSYLKLGKKKAGEEILSRVKEYVPTLDKKDQPALFGMLIEIQENYDVKF